MKNVLIICPEFLPVPAVDGGAIEQLIDNYLKHNSLTEKFNITIYSPYSENLKNIDYTLYKNVQFRYIHKNSISFLFYKIYYALLRKIFRYKRITTAYCKSVVVDLKKNFNINYFDVVLLENQVEHIPFYYKKLKRKVVLHLHNDYLNKSFNNEDEILNGIDMVWGVSDFICRQVNMLSNSIPTRTLYNGVDLDRFSRNSFIRKKVSLNEDFNIIYCGRIMPEKGVLELVKAFNIVKKKCSNIKLYIVGKKLNNSKRINSYYNSIIDEISDNKDIVLKGFLSQDELAKLYALSHLQVVPSLCNEAFGLILVEGMASYLPLLATNVGGIPEIVNNDNAFLVYKDDVVNDIARTIEIIYNNYDIAINKSLLAKKDSIKFSVERFVETFEKNLSLYINAGDENE